MYSFFRFLHRTLRVVVFAAGVAFLLILALCFSPYPWRLYASVSSDDYKLAGEPDVLVMMGSGGIPSEGDLMRSYTLAEAARQHPNAMVAVAITDTNDPAVVRLKDELALRGIKSERIIWEDRGRNTREQALFMHNLLYADGMKPSVLLVTSPNHLRRALLAFRKVGFHDIEGLTEFGASLGSDLAYQASELGGTTNQPVAALGHLHFIRYDFWNNIGYLMRAAHSLTAMAYYKMMGWI